MFAICWMKQVPDSLLAFQHMFPDDDACAAWLIEMRWPGGFRCPECGHDKGWALRSKAHTFECAGCRRQTSVTAGTILHGSKLPLTVWFWAVYLMATHSNGISALQLQKQLGIGSYRSAWLLAHKLRTAMVDPVRSGQNPSLFAWGIEFPSWPNSPWNASSMPCSALDLVLPWIRLSSSGLPRRVRLSLQPTQNSPRRFPLALRSRPQRLPYSSNTSEIPFVYQITVSPPKLTDRGSGMRRYPSPS